jgi:hypothetical protein
MFIRLKIGCTRALRFSVRQKPFKTGQIFAGWAVGKEFRAMIRAGTE